MPTVVLKGWEQSGMTPYQAEAVEFVLSRWGGIITKNPQQFAMLQEAFAASGITLSLARATPVGAAILGIDELLNLFVRGLADCTRAVDTELATAFPVLAETIRVAGMMMKILHGGAVESVITKMISRQVQSAICREIYVGRLAARGWKLDEILSDMPQAPEANTEEKRKQQTSWRGQLAAAKQMLANAKAHGGSDARLDAMIPHLEGIVQKMEKVYMSGRVSEPLRAEMAGYQKQVYQAWYGKRQGRGGMSARLRHVAVECRKGEAAFARMMKVMRRGLTSGRLPSVADLVFAYKAVACRQPSGKGTSQTITFADRRGDTSVSITSRSKAGTARQKSKSDLAWEAHEKMLASLQAQPKPGDPDFIGGVEDEDAGIVGKPDELSNAIANKASELMGDELDRMTR